MAVRDFALLTLVCLVWALNTIISKYVVSDLAVPPLFYAALRFMIVLALVFPWLRPVPKPLWRIVAVGLLMGGGSFALVFLGLKNAAPSAVAVVSQLGVPMTTLLSMVMLGEKVRWRRGLGIALTFAGVVCVMWDPGGFHLTGGLAFIALSAFLGSLGAVMMKQVEGVKPLQFQAWVGLSSAPPLLAASLLWETGQAASVISAGWPFVGAVVFSALVVSVVGHTTYYGLIQRYEANLISPLTLMTPLATIALGVVLTNDPFDLRMGVGTAIALAGVLIIALRPNQVMGKLLALRGRDL